MDKQGFEQEPTEDSGKAKTQIFAPNLMTGKSYSALFSLLSAFAYGFASLAMVFINKGILLQYKYSNTLLILQMIATTVLIRLAQSLKLLYIKPVNVQTARALLPLSLFYNANVVFALASLTGVNIPMYIAIKRLTPMAVLITGFFIGKSPPKLQVTLSVVTTVVGCVIAALGDFSFDLYGYAMALASVVSQTGYLVLVEKSGAEDGLSSFELMLYNSILSLPFLIIIVALTGEASLSIPLLIKQCNASTGFMLAVMVSLIMGIVLNFTMFLCTIVNSALTTTIVGVLKGVFSTTFGFFLFGGVKVHALNVTGLVINSIGGIWYSFAKYYQKIEKKEKSKETDPLLPTSVPPHQMTN